MINWKVAIFFAGFAAVVVIIAGGIGGVSAFEILLRVVLWSAVFAGIGIGAGFVIERYVAELNEMIGGEASSERSEEGSFEAILPEENPFALRKASGSEGEEDLLSGVEDDEESLSEAGDQIDEDGNERIVSREKSVNSGSPDGEDGDYQSGGYSDDEDDLEDMEADGMESVTDQADEEGSGDFDSLPEIDSFAASFSAFDETSSLNNPGESGGRHTKPKTGMDVSEIIADPSKTAKAIHTWIERDKEG